MQSILEEDQYNPLGHKVVITAICFLSFTWPILGLRFWVRHRMLHLLGADDILALLAQILYTGYCVCLMVTIHLTPGPDSSTLPIAEQTSNAFTASETTYAFSMLFLKLSLCAFFLRILISPIQRTVVYSIMVFSTITNLVDGVWVIFLCGVPHGHFTLRILARQCASLPTQKGLAYSQAATNMVTDVALASIPVWLLWNMHMKAWTKVSVGAILVLATGGCVASMVRFRYLPLILNPSFGFYKKVAPLMILCVVELGTGLLACSLATLRPLLALVVDKSSPARSAISNIISKSQHKESNKHTGTSISRIDGPELNTFSGSETTRIGDPGNSFQSKIETFEYGDESELQSFGGKNGSILVAERGVTRDGSDINLV